MALRVTLRTGAETEQGFSPFARLPAETTTLPPGSSGPVA
jgi:hypothetical protein